MSIKIAERLRPFSHSPGISCLIPQSTWKMEAFPTLLRFVNMGGLKQKSEFEIELGLLGPMDFTLEQDLERPRISIFGKTKDGYVRFFITREEEGIVLYFDKSLDKGVCLHLSLDNTKHVLYSKKQFLIPLPPEKGSFIPSQERLSLGMHKAQDWDLIIRRKDLREIFPIWLRLANLLREEDFEECNLGTMQLLHRIDALIVERAKTELYGSFLSLFEAGFNGLLIPQLKDSHHLGLVPSAEIPKNLSSLVLLKRSASLIKSLFFKEEKNQISLLPCLLPEFDCGRFIDIASNGDRISIEWSKKLLREVVWKSKSKRVVNLVLQKPLKSFRLRHSQKERGKTFYAGEPLVLNPGETLYLDRFEK